MAGAGGNEDDIIFADLVTGVSNEILQVSTAAEKKFVKLVAVEGYIVFRVTGILMHIQIGAVHFQFLVSDQFPTGVRMPSSVEIYGGFIESLCSIKKRFIWLYFIKTPVLICYIYTILQIYSTINVRYAMYFSINAI